MNQEWRGAWVAQSVKCPTSSQGMISQSVSSSPTSGSVLTAQSLEPALDSVSLSLYPAPTHAVSLTNKYTLKKFFLMRLHIKKKRNPEELAKHKPSILLNSASL